MITHLQLFVMLQHLEPWQPDGSDWRRIGRAFVRYVNWRKLAARRRG